MRPDITSPLRLTEFGQTKIKTPKGMRPVLRRTLHRSKGAVLLKHSLARIR